MSKLRMMALAIALLICAAVPEEACLAEYSKIADAGPGDLSGVHDFDFLFGAWRVHHRIQRLAGTGQWVEFDGTCTEGPLMGGAANVEEHTFERPTGVTPAASTQTMPAPPTARLPRGTKCHSLGMPSSAEYWHIGDTTIRLRRVTPRRVSGLSRSISGTSRS